MESKHKIIAAVSGVALLGLGALGGAQLFPVTHEVTKEVIKEVPGQSVIVPGPIQIQTIEKNITVEVPVDNKNLKQVLEFLHDEKGNVTYVTKDLDKGELDKVVDRIIFLNDVKARSEAFIRGNAADELHRELINGTRLDRNDIKRVRVKDDLGDVKVLDQDFDNQDAEVLVSATFTQGSVDYEGSFKVIFKDDKLDDVLVDSVKIR